MIGELKAFAWAQHTPHKLDTPEKGREYKMAESSDIVIFSHTAVPGCLATWLPGLEK